jgi:hypothetical protein
MLPPSKLISTLLCNDNSSDEAAVRGMHGYLASFLKARRANTLLLRKRLEWISRARDAEHLVGRRWQPPAGTFITFSTRLLCLPACGQLPESRFFRHFERTWADPSKPVRQSAEQVQRSAAGIHFSSMDVLTRSRWPSTLGLRPSSLQELDVLFTYLGLTELQRQSNHCTPREYPYAGYLFAGTPNLWGGIYCRQCRPIY